LESLGAKKLFCHIFFERCDEYKRCRGKEIYAFLRSFEEHPCMKKSIPLSAVVVAFLSLSACDSPSLAFQGQPATQLEMDGFTFSVRQRGDKAEAMRINRVWRPSETAVLAAAEKAIRLVTGCDIAKNGLHGDQAIVQAHLACG